MFEKQEIPYGFCACGCGQKTKMATHNRKEIGKVKGEPTCFLMGHGKKRPIEERFWEKVNKHGPDECWEWIAATIKDGYGMIRNGKTGILAHRYSYELHIGPIPDKTLVLHSYDNPPCVNPAHLFLGTNQDNVDDKQNKGRSINVFGEKHGMAKLTAIQVLEIRNRYKQGGVTCKELAAQYNVCCSAINKITLKKNWKHI